MFFKYVINPIMKLLLRSPLHGMMSANTMILEFTGRKSGKAYSTPVSYVRRNGTVLCFTNKDTKWWRNMEGNTGVRVLLQRQRHAGTPTVMIDQPEAMKQIVYDYLVDVPRDASFSGIKLDDDNRPIMTDIEEKIGDLVVVTIELTN